MSKLINYIILISKGLKTWKWPFTSSFGSQKLSKFVWRHLEIASYSNQKPDFELQVSLHYRNSQPHEEKYNNSGSGFVPRKKRTTVVCFSVFDIFWLKTYSEIFSAVTNYYWATFCCTHFLIQHCLHSSLAHFFTKHTHTHAHTHTIYIFFFFFTHSKGKDRF